MTRLLKASQLLTLMSRGKSKFPSMVMRAYADDTTLLLPGNETALRRALQIFDKFRVCSGLKLNPSKCNLLGIGALKVQI